MSAGLAATQLALSREHRLASLGALATAAAHELGTPLGTIAVVARELERVLPPNSGEAEDARLLRQQAERCRAILARLSNPEEAMLGSTARLPLGAFLEDIVEPYRGEDLEITISLSPDRPGDPEPQVWRAPELLHGLGNIIENAADFAKSHVRVQTRWNASQLRISVEDDGPGFAPEIFERIGEPYITSRPGRFAIGETEIGPTGALEKHEGMGLGFFIAKTSDRTNRRRGQRRQSRFRRRPHRHGVAAQHDRRRRPSRTGGRVSIFLRNNSRTRTQCTCVSRSAFSKTHIVATRAGGR